jgi:hypothetical protein
MMMMMIMGLQHCHFSLTAKKERKLQLLTHHVLLLSS